MSATSLRGIVANIGFNHCPDTQNWARHEFRFSITMIEVIATCAIWMSLPPPFHSYATCFDERFRKQTHVISQTHKQQAQIWCIGRKWLETLPRIKVVRPKLPWVPRLQNQHVGWKQLLSDWRWRGQLQQKLWDNHHGEHLRPQQVAIPLVPALLPRLQQRSQTRAVDHSEPWA